ncbi:MAG: AraC family transcriptional regulator [Verrucomicrobiota bacterium JB022]|nr:AraC family transcriptional regulator [Verrucomicrobiota bacterium JB022]
MEDRFKLHGQVLRRLEDLGLSPAAVLRHAGLPLSLFDQDVVAVNTAQMFALWTAMTELSQRPDIGLAFGSQNQIEHYDPLIIAALYARSFRDAIQRLARYKQLVCPEEVHVEERDGEAAVSFIWLLKDAPEPPSLMDMCFASMMMLLQRGTGQPLRPVRLEMRRPEAHRELYERHFGCSVRFNAGHDALIFHSADLDRPFLTHNPEIFRMLGPQLEQELAAKLAERTLPERVKGVIKRLLAGERPTIGRVSRELGMSARTLQRRLAAEGRTFQEVLEAARRELARHYLLHSSLELNETAFLLGYGDANSFFRAFQQWEGESPGRWRSAQRGVAV